LLRAGIDGMQLMQGEVQNSNHERSDRVEEGSQRNDTVEGPPLRATHENYRSDVHRNVPNCQSMGWEERHLRPVTKQFSVESCG
jgi:hypothetical protein